MSHVPSCSTLAVPASLDLAALDASELDVVLGGFAWSAIGRAALSGALNGASQGVQSGGILKGALSGGIMGFAQGLVGEINQPSQAAAPAPQAPAPQA